eukprot:CAMPEP_0206227188 /NCGR_PEP_ID=MMETSP0047_2-20121206/8490_1 /ASSEMBLY_ACC=CAM_ASM_000192 /TAXON_ID=195065 /ORGANISM="Chroomonas mesostigmatica_cf, Strain CCMP1168" /LENGTH=267 /DNA_ID=CAMNT_0053650323 /DNA_START=84 /DNA_END=887 /DNA_ORIENTATION=-
MADKHQSPNTPFDFWGLSEVLGEVTHKAGDITHELSEQIMGLFTGEGRLGSCNDNPRGGMSRKSSIPEQFQENQMKTKNGRRLSDTDTPGNGVHEYHPDYRLPPNKSQGPQSTGVAFQKSQSIKPALKQQSSFKSTSALKQQSSFKSTSSNASHAPTAFSRAASMQSMQSMGSAKSVRSTRSTHSTRSTTSKGSSGWGDDDDDERRGRLARSLSTGRHWKRPSSSVPSKDRRSKGLEFGANRARSKSPSRSGGRFQRVSSVLKAYKW